MKSVTNFSRVCEKKTKCPNSTDIRFNDGAIASDMINVYLFFGDHAICEEMIEVLPGLCRQSDRGLVDELKTDLVFLLRRQKC